MGIARSANARATLKVFQASVQGRSPSEIGTQVGANHVQNILRPVPVTITGPFQGRIEITLEIDASSGVDVEEFDLEVAATLILEE